MFVAGLVLISTLAKAQDQTAVPNQKPQQSEGFFGSVGRWLEEQTANVSASFKDARLKAVTAPAPAGITPNASQVSVESDETAGIIG